MPCPANSRHNSVIPTGAKRSGGTLCFNSVISTGAKRSGGTLTLSSRPERSGVEGPCALTLSSRPERSGVEGPCVFKDRVLVTPDFPYAIYFWDTTIRCPREKRISALRVGLPGENTTPGFMLAGYLIPINKSTSAFFKSRARTSYTSKSTL